jgi:hypothetical protein
MFHEQQQARINERVSGGIHAPETPKNFFSYGDPYRVPLNSAALCQYYILSARLSSTDLANNTDKGSAEAQDEKAVRVPP